ncbi:hypothetical protein NIES25_41280 [Nostoc linckia NIES-25]|nr:hypothetical protein NIES25_41280 [Nostoc linckia NIES-25]
MNFAVKISSSDTAPKSTYDVLIENQPDGTVKATLLGLPDCQGLGNTETEAIEKVSQSLQNRLENAKIVTLAIEPTQSENPWLKFAGMHKDNPLFEQVLDYIEEERSEFDKQMETCHENFINELDNQLEKLGQTDLDDNITMKRFYLDQLNLDKLGLINLDEFTKILYAIELNQKRQINDEESNLE